MKNELYEIMSSLINFDYEKCTKCRLCILACGSDLIENNDENKPFLKYPNNCIDCGHCVAVCPENVITHARLDKNDFKDLVDPKISYEQFINLVRNRRSMRHFKKKQLSPDHIEQLLKSVRYIPTGSNEQRLRYLFITNPKTLQNIKEAMAKKFKSMDKFMNFFFIKPFISKNDRESFGRQVELWKNGEDPFLRNAPCLLLIYSDKKYFGITAWDAGIASYNIDLTAQTLGIGTLHNGFHVSICKFFKSVKKISQIPKGHKIFITMCLGYPNLTYKRTINRRELKSRIE